MQWLAHQTHNPDVLGSIPGSTLHGRGSSNLLPIRGQQIGTVSAWIIGSTPQMQPSCVTTMCMLINGRNFNINFIDKLRYQMDYNHSVN